MMNVKKILYKIFNKGLVLFTFLFFIISINNYIKKIDYFDIDKISIDGTQFLDKDEIKSIINDDAVDKNIFNIDFNKIKKKLDNHSFINSSQVYTLFPSSFFIEINEIKPIGLWSNDNKIFLINYFSDKIEIDLDKDYKIINHYNIPTIIVDNKNFSDIQIRKILKKILTNSNLLFNSLNEVHVNEDYIKISLDKKTKIILNNNNNTFNELNIMFEFYSHMQEDIHIYEYIDLSANNQIIVKEKNITI